MANGRKTGGRIAGTPNRKTAEVLDLLDSLSCNPIEGMARIATNEKHTPELRGRMYAELAQYVYPKRKSVELAGDKENPLQLQVLSAAETLRQRRQERLEAMHPKQIGESQERQ
jgi:hypothetical protein